MGGGGGVGGGGGGGSGGGGGGRWVVGWEDELAGHRRLHTVTVTATATGLRILKLSRTLSAFVSRPSKPMPIIIITIGK